MFLAPGNGPRSSSTTAPAAETLTSLPSFHPAANLGANLKVWDRLFGTMLPPDPTLPLGRPTDLDDTHRLLWPR